MMLARSLRVALIVRVRSELPRIGERWNHIAHVQGPGFFSGENRAGRSAKRSLRPGYTLRPTDKPAVTA